MSKCAIYARVSTDDQHVATQLLPLRDFCKRKSFEVVEEYVDEGYSGKNEKRPAFERLLFDMRHGKFECIVCYKLDRIGRSLKHLLNLFEEFANRKIEFVSISQNIDTNTPEGRMFLKMLMVLAEFERELIVSRIVEGLKRAKREGKRLGRPPGKRDGRPRAKSGYYLRYFKGKKSSPHI